MKKMIIVLLAALVTINIWAKDVTPADKLPTYYQSLNNKSGADLWDAVQVSIFSLRAIMNRKT